MKLNMPDQPPVRAKRAIAPANAVRPVYQNRSRETRDLLLKAGERVFGARGYLDANIRDIAEEAGCSVGTFYGRFKDKEALFRALEDQYVERTRIGVDLFFEREKATTSVEEIIHNFLTGSRKVFTRRWGFYRAQDELSLQGHDVRSHWRELEHYTAQKMYEFLLERGAKIDAPDPIYTVELGIRIVTSFMLRLVVNPLVNRQFDNENIMAELTRNIMMYWGLRR